MMTRTGSGWAQVVAGAVLCCTVLSVHSFGAAGLSGEINYMPRAGWNFDIDGGNKQLSYGADGNTFTKVAGSFCEKNTGLLLGVDVDVDADGNVISKASKLMGYLGYKKTYLRFERGSMNGSYHWNGSVTADMDRNGTFEQSITSIDLLLRKSEGYIGLGYTSYALPVEVKTLYTNSDKANQKNGISVYDRDYKAQFYSFLFGFDTFSAPLAGGAGFDSSRAGFGMFISAEDRIGGGSSQLGKKAIADAETLNPGLKPVTDSFFAALVENNTSLGVRWFSTDGAIGLGLGYEFDYIATFNFGGEASQPGDLGFDVLNSMMRHGVISRMFVRW